MIILIEMSRVDSLQNFDHRGLGSGFIRHQAEAGHIP